MHTDVLTFYSEILLLKNKTYYWYIAVNWSYILPILHKIVEARNFYVCIVSFSLSFYFYVPLIYWQLFRCTFLYYVVLGPAAACPMVWGFPCRSLKTIGWPWADIFHSGWVVVSLTYSPYPFSLYLVLLFIFIFIRPSSPLFFMVQRRPSASSLHIPQKIRNTSSKFFETSMNWLLISASLRNSDLK